MRDFHGTDGYWLGLLTAPERELSRVDIRSSALTIRFFTLRTKPSFPGPHSRAILTEQTDTGQAHSLLRNVSRLASTFAFPPSQFTFLPFSLNPRSAALIHTRFPWNRHVPVRLAHLSGMRALPCRHLLFRPQNSPFHPSRKNHRFPALPCVRFIRSRWILGGVTPCFEM